MWWQSPLCWVKPGFASLQVGVINASLSALELFIEPWLSGNPLFFFSFFFYRSLYVLFEGGWWWGLAQQHKASDSDEWSLCTHWSPCIASSRAKEAHRRWVFFFVLFAVRWWSGKWCAHRGAFGWPLIFLSTVHANFSVHDRASCHCTCVCFFPPLAPV